ncbi:diphosphomevalonate decarboxylase [candidate division KSB1 bacterium]|nr:diphosphomevalonate decarboxylase [candidate division KSB1 bacterium]
MTRGQVVQKIIGPRALPHNEQGEAFAPSNIALCKYWGKRNSDLNLPLNSSLSLSLGHLGTHTRIRANAFKDEIYMNEQRLDPSAQFSSRLIAYLDLFRPASDCYFRIDTHNNFPTAAGLASSASGYAALAMALNNFFSWNLDGASLSILARLGSGSAARSVYDGFVEWHRGESEDGMDSYAEQIPAIWSELRLAIITVSRAVKTIGSTEGMRRTVETSALYAAWPEKATRDIESIRHAIWGKDFAELGGTAESNALAMHATMLDSRPALLYWLPETVAAFHKIWRLRQDGIQLYFTIDAGPNVKILFEEKNEHIVRGEFDDAEIVRPFVC